MNVIKILVSLTLCLMPTLSPAQTPAYVEAMTQRVATLDSLPLEQFAQEASEYERYASIAESDWLASYYAAYCKAIIAISRPQEADALTPEVEALLVLSEQSGGDASEIACLRSLMATARLIYSPQDRYMTDGAEAMRQLTIALKHNANNPRAYFLQGQSLLYTPVQFGGGLDKARPLLERCIELHLSQTPVPDYAPRWGASRAAQLLGRKLTDREP